MLFGPVNQQIWSNKQHNWKHVLQMQETYYMNTNQLENKGKMNFSEKKPQIPEIWIEYKVK